MEIIISTTENKYYNYQSNPSLNASNRGRDQIYLYSFNESSIVEDQIIKYLSLIHI